MRFCFASRMYQQQVACVHNYDLGRDLSDVGSVAIEERMSQILDEIFGVLNADLYLQMIWKLACGVKWRFDRAK